MSKKPSRVRKLLRAAGFLLAVLLALLIVATIVVNVRGTSQQRAVMNELEQAGLWPTPAQVLPADNGADHFLAALAALDDPPFDEEGLPRLSYGPSTETSFGVAIDPAMAQHLAAFAEARRVFLDEVELAIAAEGFAFDYDWYATDYPYLGLLGKARRVARTLSVLSLHEQAAGDADAALDRVTDVVRLNHAGDGDRLLITYLVSISIDALACHEAQEALSRREPSADAVSRLIEAVERIDNRPMLVEALRGEVRAQARLLTDLDRYVDQTTREVLASIDADGMPMIFDTTVDPRMDPLVSVLPEWAQVPATWNVKLDLRLTRWCHAVWPGWWRSYQSAQVREVLAVYESVAAIDVDRDDYFVQAAAAVTAGGLDWGQGVEASTRTGRQITTSRRVTVAGLRVERYRLTHGDWPATLADADADFADPYAAGRLVYKRLPDGVVVYSVGPDGTDGGGVQESIYVIDGDIAFRLLDPAVRGTLSPPPPPPEFDMDTPMPWETE